MFLLRRKDSPDARAMKRALILRSIFAKALATPPADVLDALRSRWSREEKRRFAVETAQMFGREVQQLKVSGLWRDVEINERNFLLAGIDQVTTHQQVQASWLAESIVCLLWALKIVSVLPEYDRQANPESVKTLPAGSVRDLVRGARLRPEEEIKRERQIAELWHWRARTRRLQEEGRLTGPIAGDWTIEQIIAETAKKGADDRILPPPIASDFPAMGKPYRDLTNDEFLTMSSIAQERHKALNWLCGLSPSGRWAGTPTST